MKKVLTLKSTNLNPALYSSIKSNSIIESEYVTNQNTKTEKLLSINNGGTNEKGIKREKSV